MIGSCAQDTSAACPLGWKQDVNFDCLAPTNYEGRCVVRKDFRGMSNGQKAQWAHACGVEWCVFFSTNALHDVAMIACFLLFLLCSFEIALHLVAFMT